MGLPSNGEFHYDELDLSDGLTVKGFKVARLIHNSREEPSSKMSNVPHVGIEDIFNASLDLGFIVGFTFPTKANFQISDFLAKQL